MTRDGQTPTGVVVKDHRMALRARAAAHDRARARRRAERRSFLRRLRRVVCAVMVSAVAGVLMYILAMSGVVKLLDGSDAEPALSSTTAP